MLSSKALSADTWLERLEKSNYTYLLLFALSMGETLILPIPIEAILIPWMLRKPEKRWVIAAVALAGNITAASLGYWLGALAMEQWGDSLIKLFGGAGVYDSFATELKENGFMSVLAVGITPTPLQIAMLAAGATVRAHDPEALKEARKVFGDRIEYSHNQYDILANADALTIITDWNEYRNPDFDRIKDALKEPLIVDGRNLYKPERMARGGFRYIPLGRCGGGVCEVK